MENVDNTEKTVGIDDLLIHAIEKRPNEFQDIFNDLLTQRIADRLEVAKQEVAANYFNYTDSEEEQNTESEEPVEQEEQETTDEVEQNGQDAETV